jgi:hypothetical protein
MVEINYSKLTQEEQRTNLLRGNANGDDNWDILQSDAVAVEAEEDVPVAAMTEMVPMEQDPFYIDESSAPYMDRPNRSNNEDDDDDEDKQIECASGVTAGILGTIVAGPIIGLVAGFGSAYGTRKQTKSGDFARSIGKLGISVQHELGKIDEQHQIRQNTANKWNEWSDRSPVLAKTNEVVKTGWKSASQFTKDHNLIERGIEGTGKGFEWVGRKINGDKHQPHPAPADAPSVSSE